MVNFSEHSSKSDIKQVLADCFSHDQKAIQEGNVKKTKHVFRENAKILKQIINSWGWPSEEKFDRQTESNAWLIAQHADHDFVFQLQCLSLLLAGDVSAEVKTDIAYLLDRILVNLGGEQVFATQIGENVKIPQTAFPKKLNELRKSMNLDTIESYLNKIKEL